MIRLYFAAIALCAMSLLPTTAQVIVDSDISLEQALIGTRAPREVTARLVITSVDYFSTDGLLHRGQLVVDSSLVADLQSVFSLIRECGYPVDMVVPIKFDLPDDGTSMAGMNNTYGFHYRAKIGGGSLSLHASGRAVDINPFNNPFVSSDGTLRPRGSAFDTADARTLTADHPVVRHFLGLGWTWGGAWGRVKDYMHFEKR